MYSSVRKTVRRTVIAAILCAVLCIFGASAEEPFTDADSKAAWVVENYTDSSMTDEEKAYALHDWLILNAYYDLTKATPNCHEAAGVLLDGTGVCDSYSKAYVLLLSKAGIDAKIVSGEAVNSDGETESHSWNLVKLDGKWYQVDVTWDDPVDPQNPTEKVSGLEHRVFFKASKRLINEKHLPDQESAALIDQLVEDDPEYTEDMLPAGVDHSKSYDLPQVHLIGSSGNSITGETMRGKDMILVYGRVSCINTQAFLSDISPAMSLLNRKNVQVTVALFDDPSGSEMTEFTKRYPGIVCTKVASDDFSMWEGLETFGNNDTSVVFPVIFLKNRNNKLTFYSTSYVDSPLAIVSGALAMAGEDQPAEPEEEPEEEPVEPEEQPEEELKGVEGFVTRCYRVILGRNPDPEGFENWCAALSSGKSAASEIIDGFVNSQEFLNNQLTNEESVEVLYQAMLGRGSDPAGLADWTKKLDDGNPFALIINGFCGSTEFTNLCNEYGITPGSVAINEKDIALNKIKAFVKRCYNVILDRDAEPEGLENWTNALSSGKSTASEIIDGFVNSQEFLNKQLSNEESVEVLYRAMLGRGSDPAGKADWVGKLNEGNPFAVIINGFCGSTEFTNICNDYGITPGSVKIKDNNLKAAAAVDEVPSELTSAVTEVTDNPAAELQDKPEPEADEKQSPYTNDEEVRSFIQYCYTTVLGRSASEGELADYTERIMSGKAAPKKVAEDIIFSSEFQNRNLSNEDVVRILYRLYLRQDIDEDTLNQLVLQLDSGKPLKSLVSNFANSKEFKAFVNTMK